ncbi:MAG: ATP-binding protein [Oscillospiraceae bacterium]
MKKRIFRVLTAMILGVIILLSIIMTEICYSFYKTQSMDEVKAIAAFCEGLALPLEDFSETLEKSFPYDIRVTLISPDGNVKFDTAKTDGFDNHSGREEFKEVLENGFGEAIRTSSTLGKDAYYYAIKYDGDILRFSREINSMTTIFFSILPFIIIAAILTIILSTFFASKLSDSIIKPITSLVGKINIFTEKDNDEPLETDYEELRPISITVRELMEKINDYIAQLKEEKATISLITDNMLEGMILLDNGLNILSVNKSAIGILNKDFIFEGTKNIIQLSRSPELLEVLDNAKGNSNGSSTGLIKTQDSRCYKIFANSAALGDNLFGTIVMLFDTTEAVKAEEIRRDFAANVSHELKTPLTTIKGFGEMLSEGIISETADVSHYGKTIFRESERMLLLITDIMRLSEIEECSDNQSLSEVDISDCVNETLTLLTEKARAKNISIITDCCSAKIIGNRSYLNELVLNLADNAVKYNNENGEVKITLKDVGDSVYLTVKDNGIGIPKEHQERIFERFYRVDKSRSKLTGGTGLGLSIVKHIVQFHNAVISLKSDEGKGTEITVIFKK